MNISTVAAAARTQPTGPIKGLPWDNIIFGETSLGFGVLLAATSWYLWRNREALRTADNPVKVLADLVRPISFFLIALGALLFPWAVKREAVVGRPGTLHQVAGWAWVIGGLGFFLFGALNFFTHIGLIFNTNVPS